MHNMAFQDVSALFLPHDYPLPLHLCQPQERVGLAAGSQLDQGTTLMYIRPTKDFTISNSTVCLIPHTPEVKCF